MRDDPELKSILFISLPRGQRFSRSSELYLRRAQIQPSLYEQPGHLLGDDPGGPPLPAPVRPGHYGAGYWGLRHGGAQEQDS